MGFRRVRPGTAPGAGAIRETIEAIVAATFGVERGSLQAPTRGRARVALARQVAMYLAHVAYRLTLTEVGRAFDRDRTTVAHACCVVEDLRDEPAFDRTLDLLEVVISHLAAQSGLPTPRLL